MSGHMYSSGIDGWVDWPATAHVWLLLGSSGEFFDPTHATIADVAGSELTVAGYARLTLVGAAQADSPTGQSRWYGCDNPAWTGLAAGEVTGGLVLAEQSSGRLLAFWECVTATDVGDLAFNFAPWQDGSATPLPGGTASTRLIHEHYVQPVNP